MSRLRIAAIVTALVALAVAPAAARATVTSTHITTWTSSEAKTPANNPYLISFDNPPQGPTLLTVTGTATSTSSTDKVDIVCYFGSPDDLQDAVLQSDVPVTDGKFSTYNPQPHLSLIAGHACRLRAVPTGDEATGDNSDFAVQDVAVSEAALPVSTITSGPNAGTPYNVYVNDVTFAGTAAWGSPGVTPATGQIGCGGPYIAPIDPEGDVGNFAIDCAGSLMSNDLGAFGGRSEVQIDGNDAYDPASAQSLFAASGSNPASQNLSGFPTNLTGHVFWDPATGLLSSSSTESWVRCKGHNDQVPTYATCPSLVASGVELERDITTSDGGRVVTMTDKWISTDGNAHTVDLLDDDYVGLFGVATGDRGYEFPGQTSFSEYQPGTMLQGPSGVPGSILVRTNLTAPDGDPSEAVGAITFGSAPSEYSFVSNNEFEEHHVLTVPAAVGGTASLSYVYSVGYSVADVTALALAAQDRFESPSVVIGSPAGGTTVSSPTVTVSGIAGAGSGIASLVVNGQPVPVAPGGAWTAQVSLNPGANTITAVATDAAGATAQAQLSVTYNAPASPAGPAPGSGPGSGPVKCEVPRLKGMKLVAAKKALREAHCRPGKIKHERSRAVRSGRVVSASPGRGHTFPAGHRVELFVSKGP